MKLKEQNTALLIIDFQKGFDFEAHWGGNRNNKCLESNVVKILNKWRELNLPVFHILHSSMDINSKLHASHAGFEMKYEIKPLGDEPIIVKHVNSAFIGTDLQERLEKQQVSKLVIVGLTTDHCISTSVRMAGNFGFEVLVISDATATFDKIGMKGEKYDSELIHQTALASLNGEFARVIQTSELFEIV
jgi:nicotinamidase-related amidase